MKKIIFLILIPILTYAQEFTASVNQNPVAVGEQFQVTYTLNMGGSRFQAPSMPDFHVLSGPNQSTSMQFVNGNMSQSVSFSFILQPKAEGAFTIGPATVEAGGKRIQSNSLQIKVVKGNPQSQRQGQQGGGGQQSQAQDANIADNLFLKVSVNKTNVYQGEEILATYKVYFRVTLVNYGLDKMPSMTGFWAQDIEMPKQPEVHKEVIDGVPFNVAEIKKSILLPQQSGTLTLEPMEAQTVVRVQTKRRRNSGDIFDQLFDDPFFGGGAQDINYKLKSNAVKINVKPLPTQGQPEGFSGAVGKFSMESFIDKPETKANDPVALKIKISGKGNIKLIDAPKITFPPDIETYDPKVNDNITTTQAGVSGSRTFEYLLIPRHSGEYKIDPFSFSYFDIDKKAYVTLNSPDFKIKVEKGSGTESATAVVGGVSKEDVQLLGKDIRFIKIGNIELKESGEYFFGSGLFYALMIAPLLLFIAFIIFYQKNKELASNLTLMKSKKANKVARKRLTEAKKFVQEGKKEQFYDEIFKALWGYASDRLGIPISQLTKDNAASALSKKGIDVDLVNKFILTLDNSEFARFAPGANAEMQSMYDNTIELITKLEEEIK